MEEEDEYDHSEPSSVGSEEDEESMAIDLVVYEKVRSSVKFEEMKGEEVLSAGTLTNLVLLLAFSPNHTNSDFEDVFLLSFRQFCSKRRLIDELESILSQRPSTHKNISHFLHKWILRYFRLDFAHDRASLVRLTELCMLLKSNSLISLLDKHLQDARACKRSLRHLEDTLPPSLPSKLTFLSLSSKEIVHSLTKEICELFHQVSGADLLESSVEGCKQASPCVSAVVNHFNSLSQKLVGGILTEKGKKKKLLLFNLLVDVARQAVQMHNFHLVMAVLVSFLALFFNSRIF